MRQQIPAIATVGFDPNYGRSVRVAEFDRPMMGDDVETAQTIAYMEELSSFDAGERSVIEATHRALEEAGIDMSASPIRKAKAIFWFLKRTIRYVPTPATSLSVDQTLIAPSAILAMKDPEGDCPQFSMLAASMFRICCVVCLFKTIAAEPSLPHIFSHVYNVVEVEPGTFMPFDSSNGPAPGAEFAKPFKQRVWPRTVPDRCRQKKGNLLMMRTGSAPRGLRNRILRGALGDDGDYGGETSGADYGDETSGGSETVFSTPGSGDFGGETSAPNSLLMTGPLVSLSNPALQTGSGSSGGSSIFTTLANDLTSLAAPLIRSATAAKPYYITNAQGQQVLYNPATGQTIAGTGLSSTALIGIALLAFVFIAAKK